MNEQSEQIRKQVYELTSDDLDKHPLWEFCLDEEGEEGQDEATVKPSEIAADEFSPGKFFSPGMYIIAADVTFGDKTTGVGYLYSDQPTNFGGLQPNVVSGGSQVNFWLGSLLFMPNLAERLPILYARLGKESGTVFPIVFQTRIPVNGKPFEVTVESFMAMDKDRSVVRLG